MFDASTFSNVQIKPQTKDDLNVQREQSICIIMSSF